MGLCSETALFSYSDILTLMVRTGQRPVRTVLYIPYKKDFVSLHTEMKDPNSIIFIDTEFTSTTSEILELCVVNGAGEVLYHNHFKPVRAKYWRKYPHNITKTRVRHCRSFRRCLPDIQRLFDKAELVCGYAVDNDFRHLAEEGLKIRADKALELRYLYWALRHDSPQVTDPFNLLGLSACATELCPGIELDAVHSAKGDTLTTFRLFGALTAAMPQHDWSDIPKAWHECLEEYRQGVAEYYRQRARGYVVLKPIEGGYAMDIAKEAPTEDDGSIIVEVADRCHALAHFHDKFCRRLLRNLQGYALSDSDMEYIRNYTNTFDPTSYNAYKKLTEVIKEPSVVAQEAAKGKSTRIKRYVKKSRNPKWVTKSSKPRGRQPKQ